MVYLETGEGDFNLVASKTRVAPIQSQIVPRLELLAALLLPRLMESIRSSLDGLLESLCFTDSLVVLHCIKGVEKNWKPFVQNRVTEISLHRRQQGRARTGNARPKIWTRNI